MDVYWAITVFFEFIWALILTLVLTVREIFIYMTPYCLRTKKDVSNEIVLITGAGSGFGRLYAERFSELGSTVVLWDINETALRETAKIVKDLGGKVYFYVCDVSKEKEVYLVADEVRRDVGDVTILINNAGVVCGKDLLDAPDHLLHRTIDVNVKSVFWTYKAFAPSILKKNHGHFVLMASASGLFPANQLADYSASKSANCGFEEAMFLEFELAKPDCGVHSTIINPFFTNTGMLVGVNSRFPFVLPIYEPKYVIDFAMNAILTNQRYVILPSVFLRILLCVKTLVPYKALTPLTEFFGHSNFMKTFVGRAKDS